MRGKWRRIVSVSALGAVSGAVAAWIAYLFRSPDPIAPPGLDITVDDMTLSNETWAIVGLTLLGALVCGSVAASYVWRKGLGRVILAILIAAPLGALLCWGARWCMDQLIYAKLGGPETKLDPIQAIGGTQIPWLVWQVGVGVALALPIVLAIGPSLFTLLRGLISAGLVIVLGYGVGATVGTLLVLILVPVALSGRGGDPTAIARFADVVYLFTLGAAAGMAFAFAEAIYKPAWLKSYGGPTEGRTWPVAGEFTRIGCQEGIEVFLPPDGQTAPLHAHIQTTDEGHWLAAVGGPTLVEGTPVQGAWLSDGNRLTFGAHHLVFRTRVAPVGRPATRAAEPAPQAAAVTQTAAPLKAPSPLPAARSWVLLDPMGNRHLPREGPQSIGREPDCDIALTWEASVSRRHAELIRTGDDLKIRDLGSTNGTFVNEQPASNELPLAEGDTLRLGACRMKVSKE